MADQILFYLKFAAFLLLVISIGRKFYHVRNFSALVYACLFTATLKLLQLWFLFLLVLRPHLHEAQAELIELRLSRCFVIFSLAGFALAIYYLGGKPSAGFWNWLGAEQENVAAGTRSEV